MKIPAILLLSAVLSIPIDYGNYIHSSRNFTNDDSVSTVTLTFVGDLMCHGPQFEYAQTGKDSFDFRPSFAEIKKYLNSSDLTIGNLETTISGKGKRYSGYPLFNTPDEYLIALKDAGFDILFTANNHSLDRGKPGLERTINKINESGMTPIGSFSSQKDRDSIRIFEVKGFKIALIAFTYGLNGNYISKKEKFLINVIDTNLVKSDILSARLKKADVVIVYFHFGDEYQREPNNFQKNIVKKTIDYGADLIIGSHPHVIQSVQYFNSSKNNIGRGIVAYSLGNFISNQRWRYSDAGIILNVSLNKQLLSGGVELSNISYIPTWVYKGKINNKKEFVILPADTSIGKWPGYLDRNDSLALFKVKRDVQTKMNKLELLP